MRFWCIAPAAIPLGGVAAMLACIGCGGASADAHVDSASAPAGLVGKPAPDFAVASAVNGSGQIALSSLRGQVVLIDFWGTFCEPCKKSFPRLQDLNAKYGASGLKIVGISEDEADDKEKIPDFASAYGARFVLGWDQDKAIARSYRPETMPSSFLVDRNGIVRYAHAGYHDGDEVEVEREIKTLLGQ
jgi:peroxiredoxin